ncbi:MAG: DUF1501 domain-containing protein [Planctomycetes bacterium]|nr:DUF1501 domain-containing protein [Planctomycetota bacterium]
MNDATQLSRRSFLRAGAALAGVAALGALPRGRSEGLKAAPLPNHKRLVVLNLLGGNDGMNTVYPATGTAASTYLSRRPTLGFAAGAGLALSGLPDFNLHPALGGLQTIWNAGDLAIISKVGYPTANLSHFVSEDIWSTGARNFTGLAVPGWVARYGNLYAPTGTGVVSVGMGRRLDFEGATANPLLLDSISSFQLEVDYTNSNNHNYRVDVLKANLNDQPATGRAGEIAAAQKAALDAAAQVQAAKTAYATFAATSGVVYPNTSGMTWSAAKLVNSLKDVAALIYGGFDTRIYYTGMPGGFDTHSAQLTGHDALMSGLASAILAFRDDMVAMGTWNDTVIVVFSEFGRRNYENGSDGTDHGHGNYALALGGPGTGGLYGDPVTATDINLEYLGYTTDFRDVYKHAIQAHLGNDPAPVFSESYSVTKAMTFL